MSLAPDKLAWQKTRKNRFLWKYLHCCMNDEDHIRFGLCLPKDKPFVDAVLDDFAEEENAKQRTIGALKEEIKKLREENTEYKEAYFDQWYNNREIEKCWNVISGYNRQHLELHEAIQEYIRNREWDYEFQPKTKDACTCWESGYTGPPCVVHSQNANFPPNSTEQKIKGR